MRHHRKTNAIDQREMAGTITKRAYALSNGRCSIAPERDDEKTQANTTHIY